MTEDAENTIVCDIISKLLLPLEEEYYMESLYKFLKDTYQIVIERGKDTL